MNRLKVKEGEILVVRFTDVGEGWIQCENGMGKSGLVPEAYVELTTTAVPVVPVPTPVTPTPTGGGFNDDDWGNVFGTQTGTQNQAFAPGMLTFMHLKMILIRII